VKTIGAIGIGSNQGNRIALMEQAIQRLLDLWEQPSQRSSMFETEAWGMPQGTPPFLNQVLLVHWEASPAPEKILKDLLDVEQELGRTREAASNPTYSSRTIDLDFLFLEGHRLQSEQLTLPHPRLTERRFVLEPLNELCPDLVFDASGMSTRDLLLSCKDETLVRPYIAASET
jgi:2-amino-4-hydroxy-6-hydroxymethyldihydropteridine diphosphokinase